MRLKENAISENAIWKKYDIPRVWFEMAYKDHEWGSYNALPNTADQIYVNLQRCYCSNAEDNGWLITVTIEDTIIAFEYSINDTIDEQNVINKWVRWIHQYYKVVPRDSISEDKTWSKIEEDWTEECVGED